MKTLYLDCFSGISGNMFIGALIDLGLDLEGLGPVFHALGLKREDLILEKVDRQGIQASYFNLRSDHEKHDHIHGHDHPHDHTHSHDHHHDLGHSHGGQPYPFGVDHKHSHHSLADVVKIIEDLQLDKKIEELAKKIFYILAQAEAKVHGKGVSEVHFHEVGEVDSILDSVLAAVLFYRLGVDRVIVSPINPGRGRVGCAHGLYPVPAPATLEVLAQAQAPLGGQGGEGELTTPTGAAIVAALSDGYADQPQGRVLATGYGAGSRNPAPLPNVLRAILLEEGEEEAVWYSFNVDDMTGEEMGFLMDRLFESGARDVTFTPLVMKKNRPGQRIDVLGSSDKAEDLIRVIFTHSTTLGLKRIHMDKLAMERSVEDLGSPGRPLRKKTASYQGIEKSSYEYEDLKNLAILENTSLRDVLSKEDKKHE